MNLLPKQKIGGQKIRIAVSKVDSQRLAAAWLECASHATFEKSDAQIEHVVNSATERLLVSSPALLLFAMIESGNTQSFSSCLSEVLFSKLVGRASQFKYSVKENKKLRKKIVAASQSCLGVSFKAKKKGYKKWWNNFKEEYVSFTQILVGKPSAKRKDIIEFFESLPLGTGKNLHDLFRKNKKQVDVEALILNTFHEEKSLSNSWLDSIEIDLNQLASVVEMASASREELGQQRLASMRQLAYGASHEVNNPLANISLRAQVLVKDETDPARRKKLETINRQAMRAHDMISNMMYYAHPPKPDLKSCNLLSITETVCEEMQQEAVSQGTSLELEDANLENRQNLDLICDENQVALAVRSLIQNALESLSENGNVRVEVSADGVANSIDQPSKRMLSVKVIDDGPGFTADVRQHLFDPFYSGREAGRGLGFGLPKVWRIAKMHSGGVSCESKPDKRTEFVFQVPNNLEMQKSLELGCERSKRELDSASPAA